MLIDHLLGTAGNGLRPEAPIPGMGWSTKTLNEGLTRHRIAILAFDEVRTLWRAVNDLLLNGFGTGQFCLFGHPAGLAALAPPHNTDGRLRDELNRLIGSPPARVMLPSADVLEMRCGPHAGRLFVLVDHQTHEAGWIRPDLARRVAADVVNGCIVLLIASLSADQHALGARLLLSHGTRDLQTHEFSGPLS